MKKSTTASSIRTGALESVSPHPGTEFRPPDFPHPLECLLNYFSIAIEAIESRSIILFLCKGGAIVQISVEDSGIRVVDGDIPYLFTPFERLESKLRVKASDIGLGQNLVKYIASDGLGRGVAAESRLKEGRPFA